jgi:hypothetical protein
MNTTKITHGAREIGFQYDRDRNKERFYVEVWHYWIVEKDGTFKTDYARSRTYFKTLHEAIDFCDRLDMMTLRGEPIGGSKISVPVYEVDGTQWILVATGDTIGPTGDKEVFDLIANSDSSLIGWFRRVNKENWTHESEGVDGIKLFTQMPDFLTIDFDDEKNAGIENLIKQKTAEYFLYRHKELLA